jgi:hypothetical protein
MKKQNIILAILLSWLCGLACCQLFIGNKKEQRIPATDAATLQQQVLQTEAVYQEQAASLQQLNSELNHVLQRTMASLKITQQKNHHLQETLQQNIRNRQYYKQERDTAQQLAYCDSISRQTTAFIQLTRQQDSLQASVHTNLLEQLHNRDTILLVKEEQYRFLRRQFDNSLLQQQSLEENIAACQRKIKRQQLGSKLKTAGLVFLSGLVIKQLMR